MSLSQEDVDLIARLARLRLTDDERRTYAEELSRIVDYIGALQSLDTSGVTPLLHAQPLGLRMVPDEPGTPLLPEEALREAPQKQDDCFLVPHILPPAGRK
jgi:aspartyl-tRNA(Asn)/glutamyl-tRNA(Gln) amidotransferase subunit C